MKGILLAGRDRDFQTLVPGQIDKQIASLRALGLEPALVLGGNTAEEILLGNRTVESCEMAFDTHTSPTDFTNLVAASHLATGEFLAFLPELPIIGTAELAAFRHQLAIHYCDPLHLIRSAETGAWPLLVTKRGQEILIDDEELTGWDDSRLCQHTAPLTRQVILTDAGAV